MSYSKAQHIFYKNSILKLRLENFFAFSNIGIAAATSCSVLHARKEVSLYASGYAHIAGYLVKRSHAITVSTGSEFFFLDY